MVKCLEGPKQVSAGNRYSEFCWTARSINGCRRNGDRNNTLMRIGILPNLNPFAGGVCQYSLAFLRALYEQAKTSCKDEFIIYASKLPNYLESSEHMNWTLASAELPQRRPLLRERLRCVIGEGPHVDGLRWIRRLPFRRPRGAPGENLCVRARLISQCPMRRRRSPQSGSSTPQLKTGFGASYQPTEILVVAHDD